MGIFLPFLFTLTFSILSAQDNWELQKDKDNIKVYTRKVEGYDIKASKAIAIMETTIPRLVAVLMDASNYHKVIASSKSSKLLKIVSESERIYYVSTDAPWPVTDRDGIYSLKFSQDISTKIVTITFTGLPDFIPEKEGYVRVHDSKGLWTFSPLSNGKVEVTYEYVADPGGSIPAWLANTSAVNIPFDTMQNLKERAALPQYEGQNFSFLAK